MPILSIIVPIYNVEAFITKCVDSILAQTLKDFELILVDDGSPDRCGSIIDEYACKDNRIITIHQENKGVSAARNAGLRLAKGKYIGFVDPDDWIEPEMYFLLVDSLESNDCDLASCSWMDNDIYNNELAYDSALPSKVMNRDEYMSHLFDMPITVAGSVWSKLFRRELINTHFSEAHQICEDNLFVAHYCCNIDKAVYVNKHLYHVFSRQTSATRSEAGKPSLGLSARREIINVAKTVSADCEMLAEKLFLNQCIMFSSKEKGYLIEYQRIARNALLSYMKEKPFCLVKNKKLTLKQKVMLFYRYLILLEEKGK